MRLNEFWWFCLEHVRAYNAAWNYYAGMSEREIEAELKRDVVWRRPTWPLRGRAYRQPEDPFDFFSERADDGPPEADRGSATDVRALAVLDLVPPVSVDMIKRRYKELVKRHHPDANGGDRDAEERLKAINLAYGQLMQSMPA